MADFLKTLFAGLAAIAVIASPFVIGAMLFGGRGAMAVGWLILLGIFALMIGGIVREEFGQ